MARREIHSDDIKIEQKSALIGNDVTSHDGEVVIAQRDRRTLKISPVAAGGQLAVSTGLGQRRGVTLSWPELRDSCQRAGVHAPGRGRQHSLARA